MTATIRTYFSGQLEIGNIVHNSSSSPIPAYNLVNILYILTVEWIGADGICVTWHSMEYMNDTNVYRILKYESLGKIILLYMLSAKNHPIWSAPGRDRLQSKW